MDDRHDKIENIEYRSLLYDYYGQLLGDSQREVMDLYHEDDLSLAEIAEELGQTRQGVHYTLKKAEAALERYEEKLGLIRAAADRERTAAAAEELGAALLGSGRLHEEDAGLVRRLMEIVWRLKD
ncbi:MAG: hypothetical protein IJH91_10340 [Mogibacterium sp.]|nr:hypothetical protein [Mogibacterium sp.]